MSPGATVWIIDELLDNKVAPRHRMLIITPDFFFGGGGHSMDLAETNTF